VLALIAPTAPMLNYLRLELARGRQLDRGNAQPSSIGADFGRFGMRFWDDLKKIDHTSANWRNDLETLNVWRNAIVHQDFTSPSLGGIIGLQLRQVRQWRNSCRRLAMAMDEVVRQHMHGLTGSSPWLGGNMSKGNEKKPHYKPGDWVSFQWGIGDAIGQVLEDRGPIGVGGRRLYRIQPAIEYIDAFEIPEVDLKPAHHPVATKP
jgi:hypothetical protein